MALTKIGKEGITGVSNASNATFLTATSGEGVTLAGTLAVTGIHTVGTNAVATSEGGAVTTNIAQGLGKAWCNVGGGATPINDSINLSSITDAGVGNHDLNWTNAFSNTGYSHSGSDNYYGLFMTEPSSSSTGEANVYAYNESFASRDNAFATIAHGDLA